MSLRALRYAVTISYGAWLTCRMGVHLPLTLDRCLCSTLRADPGMPTIGTLPVWTPEVSR